jgi:deoxyribodipyrimidine photo-lyase
MFLFSPNSNLQKGCYTSKKINADAIYFNRQYEANECKRDQAVIDYCEKNSIIVKSYNDQCLFEPGRILTLSGQYFQIYTYFKNACWKFFAK